MFSFNCKCSDKWAKYGTLVLRVVVGAIFVYAGWQKFQDIAGTTTFFAGAGIPMANVMAYLVAGIEFVGGIMLILGIFSCIAGALLTIVMLVATWVTYPNPMLTYPLTLAVSCFAIFTSGPGELSLGACCKKACGESCKDGVCTH
jgi:putative oxidoreductase